MNSINLKKSYIYLVLFTSCAAYKKEPTHKAKSAIAHIAFLPTHLRQNKTINLEPEIKK